MMSGAFHQNDIGSTKTKKTLGELSVSVARWHLLSFEHLPLYNMLGIIFSSHVFFLSKISYLQPPTFLTLHQRAILLACFNISLITRKAVASHFSL
jgi:hypothetical protein